MISLSERELVRARWRRELEAFALDHPDRADFAEAGLVSCQVGP
jgi:hypothetical protein